MSVLKQLDAKVAEARLRRMRNLERFNDYTQRSSLGNTGERPHWDNPCVVAEHRRHRT